MVSTESGERITLVITNLLALTVFMLIVADLLPPTSEVVPLISIYITCSIFEVGIALVATCVVLMCFNTNPDIQEMPLWMRYFICQRLGRLLRVQRIKDRKAEEEAGDETGAIPRVQPRNKLFGFGSLPVPRSDTYEKLFNTAAGEKTCEICKNSKEAAYASSRPTSQFFQEAAMYKLPEGKPYESQARNINYSISTFAAGSLFQEPAAIPECRADCPCATMSPVLPILSAIVHRQDHMVRGIKKLTDNLKDEDEEDGDRDEWIYLAHVLDRLLLFIFLLTLVSSTILIFTMVYW